MKKEYVFIDFEMDVNVDSHPEQIIAIGAIKTDENGNLIDTFKEYCKLSKKENLYTYTTFLTGITNNNINKAETFFQVIKKLDKFIGNTQYIYTWGDCDKYCFDLTVRKNINRQNKCELIKLGMKLRKKIKDFRESLPKEYRKYYWTNLFKVAKELKVLKEDKIQNHDSLEDAIVLKDIYFKVKEA